MSYYRYTRLQQYINGQPTEVYKKGNRVDDVDYSTYDACMGGTADTRWVSIPQTVCYDGDLYSMEKEQISYDGISWSDTGNSRRASVIEQSSAQCFMSDWRVVPGEFICMMHAKWTKEAEYVSYDGGQTWTATGNIRRGETVIELLSADCGVIYQWIPTGEYICQGYNKYMKEKQVYSTDNGSTWTDTGNRRTGGLVEADSPYCGYEQYIYQWVDVSGEYVCQGTTKYKKQKEQRSSDNGQTWEDTGNTRQGEVIEVNSFDCGYVAYRWVSDTGYVCVGHDKYNKEKEQSSTDGINWTDTGNTRAGSTLIESLSTDCGVTYRWITVPNDYACVGYDKYNKEKEQYSTDGSTWTDTGNTRTGSTLIEHNSEDCGYDPSHDYSTEYLTTEALGSGYIRLSNLHENEYPLTNIQYSKNDGAWKSYTYNTKISVATGDKIRWKALWFDGNTYARYSYFNPSTDYKAYGNPISLLVNDNFANVTDISDFDYAFYRLFDGYYYNHTYLKDVSDLALTATTVSYYCYGEMFEDCASITTAPALPATTLSGGCYDSMFENCTSLTAAPSLPATVMHAGCYRDMFRNCTSLTTPPALPATRLDANCYYSMFNGCTSLTAAPSLPATVLYVSCYEYMFNGCTSLTTAPVLPATRLKQDCYFWMFTGCSSLNNVTCLATVLTDRGYDCTGNWLYGVSSSGTFTKAAGVSWETGISGIPEGWTVVEAS